MDSRGVVELRGLTRSFGENVAVDSLDFTVGAGELFGIVGPDGGGKTTTLRMLAGVLRPTRGSAILSGIDVVEDPEGVKPHIAYMAQRFGLYDDLTVAENLDFYADLYGVPRSERPARLERLYVFSRLEAFTDRLAGKLSGGMKQKLSLSCCLIHRPEILLLDEPTFGVDPISRRELWLILHEMVADGITIVVSTSYLDEAERCDRVVLLNEGTVLALDTPRALQDSVGGRMLEIVTDRPRDARETLRATPGIRRAILFGESVHALLAADASDAVASEALERAGIRVEVMEEATPSLEDVFIGRVNDSARAARSHDDSALSARSHDD